MSLSMQMIDALTFCEQVWWETQQVPTNEAIVENTGIGLQTVAGYWKNPDFRAALFSRGVTFGNTLDTNPKALTYQQLQVANMLMNIMDKRSIREKLKTAELGVSPAQVSAWMRQPAFQAHLKRRGEILYEGADSAAYLALVRAIDSGDMKAVQLLFEMKGIYTPRSQVDVNVHAVLARVVEIISIHVTDPTILEAIATDLEGIEGGMSQVPRALSPVNTPIGGI